MAEQRLVDAEALKHEILEICKYNCFTVIKPTSEQCNGCEIYDIYKKVIEAPTAEAKPIVHAHWALFGKNGTDTDYGCTNCGYTFTTSGNYPQIVHYCPYCGAQMDEKENDNGC